MEHTARLVQGIRGTPAPMVKSLLHTSTTLIESITGKVYNVELIHDRPHAGELFGSGARKAGETMHCDDLNALAPRAGRGGEPGCEDTLLDRPGTMCKSREGPLRSRTVVTSTMTVTYLSPYGVWRHTCSSTPMTRTPSHRPGSLISRRAPLARTAVLAVFQDMPRAWAMRATVT